MKLRLRIRSYRGVWHWLAEEGSRAYWVGPVAESTVGDIVGVWLGYGGGEYPGWR